MSNPATHVNSPDTNSTSRRTLANAIRALSMDAVQQANSGHPGMPMGMADIAEVLWNDHLKHNPANPDWSDRDRFVLSNGHGSMLIYSLLHLTGYDLPMSEIKNFRQLHSRTPGHPEYGDTPGVETTTGPLGQGFTNAVGMALSEKILAAQFNKGDHEIVDHKTYVFLGDGCLMEGISHEAASLAGTLGLNKLIAFYDDNGISIDGEVEGWFTDDTPGRFRAYGWNVIESIDGHDSTAIAAAIEKAHAETSKPTLVCCKTVIGWGSPNKQGTEGSHGAALGADEVALVRKTIGWEHDPFVVPDEVYKGWNARQKGADAESAWTKRFQAYAEKYPQDAAEFTRRQSGELPADWQQQAEAYIQAANEKAETVATRKASENSLNAYGPLLPELNGGSADLAGSNNTIWKGCTGVTRENAAGNYIYYGVREFAMSAIMNGITLHGGLIPYGGTFLTFSDYARNAVRMAALMKIRTLFVYTHDSIGLGEDGPTHQPVEHIASLRLIPNLSLWRPCDAVETAVAWKQSLERTNGPSCLILSRQNLPHQMRDKTQLENIKRGGYILHEPSETVDAIVIATGSEVDLAVQAAVKLSSKGVYVRVVSMPSTDIFEKQDDAYREAVLPASITARVAIEAGVSDGWLKYTGLQGRVIGIDRFGESAPGGEVLEYFGFTTGKVIEAVKEVISKS